MLWGKCGDCENFFSIIFSGVSDRLARKSLCMYKFHEYIEVYNGRKAGFFVYVYE